MLPFVAIFCKVLSLLRDIRRSFLLIMHKTPSPHGECVVVTVEAVQQSFAAHATNCQCLLGRRCQHVVRSCSAGFGRGVGPCDKDFVALQRPPPAKRQGKLHRGEAVKLVLRVACNIIICGTTVGEILIHVLAAG